jgi:hypothetical protein
MTKKKAGGLASSFGNLEIWKFGAVSRKLIFGRLIPKIAPLVFDSHLTIT